MIIHQLQGIPVTGGDKAFPAPGGGAGGQGTQNIVGLVSLGLHHRDAHEGQQLFEKGELGSQLVRHTLAPRLVFTVQAVTEGRGRQIEGRCDVICAGLIPQLLKNVQKAIQGVGILPVFSGEQLDTVKRPVDDTVAVQYQQPHAAASFCFDISGRFPNRFLKPCG